jgi:hypothetical protein
MYRIAVTQQTVGPSVTRASLHRAEFAPHLQDQAPPGFQQKLSLQAAINRLAADDATVHALMLDVAHLIQPASALRDPALAARIALTAGS